MKQKKVCVIGLGYVGLPMAVALSNVKVKGKFYYQTFGHERYLPDQNGLTETQIFARIPLNRACFDRISEFVQYEDSNDLFQINLQQKHLDSFEL